MRRRSGLNGSEATVALTSRCAVPGLFGAVQSKALSKPTHARLGLAH